MPILNFGSCCIDHVYQVTHFATPGETLLCSGYNVHPGGKGLNQSIAISAAGANIRHAGKIGEDGRWLIDLMKSKEIDVSLMKTGSKPTGHANIQVTPEGENSIVLFGGANQTVSKKNVDDVLEETLPGEFLLIQNEISSLGYLIKKARQKKLRIVFNAAPMSNSVHMLPLDAIELLIVNEIEGFELTKKRKPNEMISNLLSRFTSINILLTLGSAGSIYANKTTSILQPAQPVTAVDTTAAGDTFVGFFLASYQAGSAITDCLSLATRAAAICVTQRGAATSIPSLEDLKSPKD